MSDDNDDVNNMKLPELRERHLHKAKKAGGTDCLICNHHSEMRERTLNYGMAYCLDWIVYWYKVTEDWVDTRSSNEKLDAHMKRSHGDFVKLVAWGLIEPKVDSDGKDTGFFRPTQKGLLFALGDLKVPHKGYFMDDAFHGFVDLDVLVDIFQAKQLDIIYDSAGDSDLDVD